MVLGRTNSETILAESIPTTRDRPSRIIMQWYFCFFIVSGFCSILYEIVWLRLAMAQFGVTTAMVSLVLSAFMGGLEDSWNRGGGCC